MTEGEVAGDSWSRRDSTFLALLAALIGLVYADVLFLGRTLFLRDLTRYYFPAKLILRKIVLAGEFPSWNPFFGGGQPMAANPEYSVFYPLHALLLLPDYVYAFQLLIVVHVFIGAASMYLFLRSWRCRPETALIGSLLFALGGITVSLLNLLPYLFILAWTPLAFLFVRRFLEQGRRRDFAGAGLVLALQLLTPEPTTILQVWFLIGAYAAYKGWQRKRGAGVRRNLGAITLLGLIVLGTGAVQILPALDHARDSVRARPFEYRLASAWSMPVVRPLEMLYPSLFGHPFTPGASRYWGTSLYRPKPVPFLFTIYLGLLTFVLVVAGAITRTRGWPLVLFVGLSSFVLAIGDHVPLFRWLYELKITSAVRYPEKFALMGLLALLLFAIKTLDRYLDGDVAVSVAVQRVTVAVLVLTALVTLLSFTEVWAGWFVNIWKVGSEGQARYFLGVTRLDWMIALIRAGLLAAVVLPGSRKGHRLSPALLLLFVFLDLAVASRESSPRMSRSFFEEPDVARAVAPADRLQYRVFPEADWYDYYGLSRNARLYSSTGAGSFWTVQHGLLPHSPADWGISTALDRDYDKTALLPTVDLVDAYWRVKDQVGDARRSLFMAMANARWREEFRSFDEEVERAHGRPELVQPVALVDEGPTPRYYFADQVVPISGAADFTRRMVERDWSRGVAFVEEPVVVGGTGTVGSVKEWSNRSELQVAVDHPAFLVASITSHKYWRATIDGIPARLIRANVGFFGLVVPAGRHVIELRYRNRLLPFAACLSALGLVALLILLVSPRREDHHAQGQNQREP